MQPHVDEIMIAVANMPDIKQASFLAAMIEMEFIKPPMRIAISIQVKTLLNHISTEHGWYLHLSDKSQTRDLLCRMLAARLKDPSVATGFNRSERETFFEVAAMFGISVGS